MEFGELSVLQKNSNDRFLNFLSCMYSNFFFYWNFFWKSLLCAIMFEPLGRIVVSCSHHDRD
jgi:hypothetical protein